MDLKFSKEQNLFRQEVHDWLSVRLDGPFKKLRGRGGPGDEHSLTQERKEWEQELGRGGYIGLGWPEEEGGRALGLIEQVIFHEEYAKAQGPGRMGHIGEQLVAPTLIAFGTSEQKNRFLVPIREGKEYWCQGYSEPNAGSDLANVKTKAHLDGDLWRIQGQKIWTSLAEWSEWCFVLCRTDIEAPKHKGLSYLLVPMTQDAITLRPIRQLTGSSEFSEVFFDEAVTHKDNIVGDVNGGWRIAMATLAFERGVSTLGQQIGFASELDLVIAHAKRNGKVKDPVIRERLAQMHLELKIMRLNALRTLSRHEQSTLSKEGLINKLYWATWHQQLGELAMEVLGEEGHLLTSGGYELNTLQQLFLFSRSDTIYAGSNQIQRNIIGERGLGLPREPIPTK